jgi:hypothetical protein
MIQSTLVNVNFNKLDIFLSKYRKNLASEL